MVINNHDTVDSPALPVFRDIRKVTGIRLPHLPEGVLLKSLSVPQVWVSCRFQVMFLHKTLDSADTDRSGDEGLLHQVSVDLGGVKPWKGLFEPVDFFNGRIRQYPGGPLVRAFLRHEGIDAAVLVEGHPLADGLGAVAEHGSVRQGKRILGDAPVVGVPGRVGIKAIPMACGCGKAAHGSKTCWQ